MKKHKPDPDSRCDFRTLSASDWAAIHDKFKTDSAESVNQKLELRKVNKQEQHAVSTCSFHILSAWDGLAMHEKF